MFPSWRSRISHLSSDNCVRSGIKFAITMTCGGANIRQPPSYLPDWMMPSLMASMAPYEIFPSQERGKFMMTVRGSNLDLMTKWEMSANFPPEKNMVPGSVVIANFENAVFPDPPCASKYQIIWRGCGSPRSSTSSSVCHAYSCCSLTTCDGGS